METCMISTYNRGICMLNSSGQKNFKGVSCKVSMQFGEKRRINFHEVLSSISANVGEIKKAYRKLALQYHPDVCHSSMKEECTKMFVELQEAYRSLIDRVSEGDEFSSFEIIGLEKKECSEKPSRSKWENQLFELNKRSQERRLKEDGSWGCRMRARFIYP